MHHFVEGRCERHLVGSDGGVAVIGSLKNSRIADDLILGSSRFRSEPHLQIRVL